MRTLAAIWIVGLAVIVGRLVWAFGRGCWDGLHRPQTGRPS